MNAWIELALNWLAQRVVCGYYPHQPPATEPTALAALALVAHDRAPEAAPALDYLAECQNAEGDVGVRGGKAEPAWTTSLAVLAWRAARQDRYERPIRRGTQWLLALQGGAMPRTPDLGHDTTLTAWPWVAGTHSWIEPTALAVIALKAVGESEHPRTREAVRMLLDRQLPGGGCNYGNTFCLGQKLRPHVQPTGIALLALSGEVDAASRIDASVVWLRSALPDATGTTSLCWGLLGLAAHEVSPAEKDEWLEIAWERTLRSDLAPYKIALLALAATERLSIFAPERSRAIGVAAQPT